jgi:CheY-like chemotaxis protein
MYAEYLSHMGLRPVCVQYAQDAIRIAPKADLIVTELLLPGAFDGYALIEMLKCNPITRNIPIIVLTVCAWTGEEAQARRAGCAVFLSKPCLPQTLLGNIRRSFPSRVATHPRERRQVFMHR